MQNIACYLVTMKSQDFKALQRAFRVLTRAGISGDSAILTLVEAHQLRQADLHRYRPHYTTDKV